MLLSSTRRNFRFPSLFVSGVLSSADENSEVAEVAGVDEEGVLDDGLDVDGLASTAVLSLYLLDVSDSVLDGRSVKGFSDGAGSSEIA